MKKSLAIYGILVIAVALAVQMGVLKTHSEINGNEGNLGTNINGAIDGNNIGNIESGDKSVEPQTTQTSPVEDVGVGLSDSGMKTVSDAPKIDANVNITPKTIFLSDGGKFTIFISFETEDVKEIVPDSVACEGINPTGYMTADMGDNSYFMAQFNIDDIKGVTDSFTVVGKLNDGRIFEEEVEINLL